MKLLVVVLFISLVELHRKSVDAVGIVQTRIASPTQQRVIQPIQQWYQQWKRGQSNSGLNNAVVIQAYSPPQVKVITNKANDDDDNNGYRGAPATPPCPPNRQPQPNPEPELYVVVKAAKPEPTTPTTTTTTTTTAATTTPTVYVPMPDNTVLQAVEYVAKAPVTKYVKDVKVLGVCDNCLMKNGIGYVSHPDCTRYYQCYYSDNEQTTIRAVERKCSFGLYWNQKILSCDFPENVPCAKGVCIGSKPQPMEGNCRGFWDCKSGSPSGQCCSQGHSFNALVYQCVPDVTCRAKCHAKDVGAFMCRKRAASDKRHYNQWTVSGWIKMPCPPFTAFNPSTCGCSEILAGPILAPVCKAEVYLPFDRSVNDQSYKKVHVENNGVKISNGVAYFDGKGSLKINRFSNSWFGSTVVITVRYKVIDSSSRQALICNGDCYEHPTLFLGRNSYGVEFYAKTEESIKPVNFTIIDSGNGYQTATYVLDGGKLTGQTGYHKYHEAIKGNLQITSQALNIGSCGGSENFRGYIDEVAIYLCKPATVRY